ncbi:hypothetical protein [Dactylosporangium sp. NPDC051541]|uniref:hypothetical protein n=1 Tax=Dactylosporangium sp. NPDC051541 TaxID=3363977 RepID=UPI0037B12386
MIGPDMRRRRLLRPVVDGLVALAAVLYLTAAMADGDDAPAVAASPTAAAPSAAATPVSSAAAPVSPERAVEERVQRTLDAQSRALLAGDLETYLKPVHSSLREQFTLRFGSLRALGVAAWTARVAERPRAEGNDRWSMIVEIRYCLAAADCAPTSLVLNSTWSVGALPPVIVEFERTVLPWDLTPLQAVSGRRVIVAGPAETAGRLPFFRTAADRAADIADRYARWDPAPKRYVVFVAAPEQWATWWNGTTETIDAYAEGSKGIVVKAAESQDDGLVNLLTHEFAHVLSLGDNGADGRDWWLSEGFAEYVADRDGSWTKNRLPRVRRFVGDGRWDGTVTLAAPPKGTTAADRIARYGIALLTVTCLAGHFGEDKLVAFFTAVIRNRSDPPAASPGTLGADWPGVATACAAEVRSRAA